MLRLGGGPPSALPGIGAWRTAMSAFGCKPSRYPCSRSALLKRVARSDELPAINRVVDLYNAVSVPMCCRSAARTSIGSRGVVVLMPAVGDEEFDGGDSPAPGEIVWRDDLGVTCRAWNWRQECAPASPRRRLTSTSCFEAIDRWGRPPSGRLRTSSARDSMPITSTDRAGVGPPRRRDAGPGVDLRGPGGQLAASARWRVRGADRLEVRQAA